MQELAGQCADCQTISNSVFYDKPLAEVFPIDVGFSVWIEHNLYHDGLYTHCICINEADVKNGAWMRNSGWNPQAAKALNTHNFYGVSLKICNSVPQGYVRIMLCEVSEYQGSDNGPTKDQKSD